MAWSAIASICALLFATTAPATLHPSVARAARAYPISPCPLRELVTAAEVIATVRVRASESDASNPSTRPDELVVLDIDEILKGDAGKKSIRYRNGLLGCPAPDRYVPGTRALAFLDRTEIGPRTWQPEGFATHALCYGSKTLNDAELALYVERVKEQLAILAMPEGPERRAAQVEWLVRCAEQPATRWEGAYDLEPQGDSMTTYDEKRASPFAGALTVEQRNRLKRALLAAPHLDMGERCLELLLRNDNDPQLVAWLVARLRETQQPDANDSSFDRRMIAKRLAARDDRPRVGELADALHALYWKSEVLLQPDRDVEASHVAERRLVTELLTLFPQ